VQSVRPDVAPGIPLNRGANRQTVPGTGRGGVRFPDLKVFGPNASAVLGGSVIEIKNVARLEGRRQIRDLVAFAKKNKLTVEIFTNAPTPKSGFIAEAIRQGIIKLRPIPS
jgi:hypothetical protein